MKRKEWLALRVPKYAEMWLLRSKGETLESIGAKWGVTEERVRQVVWRENQRRLAMGEPALRLKPGTAAGLVVPL